MIGLGSPFLSDDSIGPRVIRGLMEQQLQGVRLTEAHAGGMLLLEELQGARRAVIVDALIDPDRQPGELLVSGLNTATSNISCSHDCTLAEAIALGRGMGLKLPKDGDIVVVAIVAKDTTTFSEDLTPEVAAVIPQACTLVRELIAGVFPSHQQVLS